MTENKQQRPILIASFSAISAPARRGGPAPHLAQRSSLVTHHCLTPFLFDTNVPIVAQPLSPALSVREGAVLLGFGFGRCGIHTKTNAHRQDCLCYRCHAGRITNHYSPITTHESRLTACLAVPVMLSCPAASRPKWFAWFGSGA